jgi:general secretion pathway protein H
MTTLATGDRRAFTLVEILLVIALIALAGWIFVGGSQAMLAGQSSTPDDQFWKASDAARKRALENGDDVQLSFDPLGHEFILKDAKGKAKIPLSGPNDLVVDFHPAQVAGSSFVLVGGTLVESTPMPAVTYYSDGTCTAYRAQIRTATDSHVLSVDPWTCAPVLTKSDATP